LERSAPPHAVKAVVFDFDGVIANSEPLHFSAFRDVLGDVGIPFGEQEYYAAYLGYDDIGVFRALSRARGLGWSMEDVSRLVAQKAVRMEILEREGSVLFPGASDAIARLAGSFPLAIASGALRAEILRVLEGAALDRFFRVVVAAEDTPASKPAPDPYLLAVSSLSRQIGQDLAPAECVAIEDSKWGLESARRAGLRTIGITHTYSADLLGPVDLAIDSLNDLTVARLRQL